MGQKPYSLHIPGTSDGNYMEQTTGTIPNVVYKPKETKGKDWSMQQPNLHTLVEVFNSWVSLSPTRI